MAIEAEEEEIEKIQIIKLLINKKIKLLYNLLEFWELEEKKFFLHKMI